MLLKIRRLDKSFPEPMRVQKRLMWIESDLSAWKESQMLKLRESNARRLRGVK
jgi:predicted DNA-binding transcriptional regulator AlpA